MAWTGATCIFFLCLPRGHVGNGPESQVGALEAIRVKILVKGEPGRLDALRVGEEHAGQHSGLLINQAPREQGLLRPRRPSSAASPTCSSIMCTTWTQRPLQRCRLVLSLSIHRLLDKGLVEGRGQFSSRNVKNRPDQ